MIANARSLESAIDGVPLGRAGRRRGRRGRDRQDRARPSATAPSGTGVLWGACDPLITPRPIGPLRDVAREAGGALAEAVDGPREDLLSAALDELARRRRARRRGPALGRRRDARPRRAARPAAAALARLPDPHLPPRRSARGAARAGRAPARMRAPVEPERAVGGGGGAAGRARRARAVGPARHLGRQPVLRHRGCWPRPPASASRRACATRSRCASRRSGRRRARSPSSRRCSRARPSWRSCAASRRRRGGRSTLHRARGCCGLQRRPAGVPARPRPPRGRGRLSPAAPARAQLRACWRRSRRRASADPARLVHHARRAGDAAAIRRLAPQAARAAAAARRAPAGARALGGGAARPPTATDPEALEGVAVEAYHCARTGARARGAAARCCALHEAAGDALRAGDDAALALADPVVGGRRPRRPTEAADRAIAALEAFPDSRELAMALSARSQLAMLGERHEEAIELGTRAERLARKIGDRRDRHPRADQRRHRRCMQRADDERGPRAARGGVRARHGEAGHDDHAARALVNLATVDADAPPRRPARPGRRRRARAALRARARARRLRPVPARDARHAAPLPRRVARRRRPTRAPRSALGEQFGVSQCPALIVLGRLQARRGDGEAGETLEEAWERAVGDARAAAAGPGGGGARRARLARRRPRADGRDRAAGVRAGRGARRRLGARRARVLALARRRAGRAAPRRPGALRARDGGRLARRGRGLGAARLPVRPRRGAQRRRRRGGAARGAARFDAFGAARAAAHLRRRLRADGVRRIPRGPRAASRAGPAGLTPRETEVLDLIVRGRHQRGDRPGAGDHAQDGRPPRLRRAGQARRRRSRREAGAAAERWSRLGARSRRASRYSISNRAALGRAEVPLVAERVERGVELLRAAVACAALACATRSSGRSGLEVLAVVARAARTR